MDRMLVIVFDHETKAYEGKSALRQLEKEGSVALYASAVILKHADGSVSVKDEAVAPPLGALVGTPAGAVIGLLGGPAGFAAGATAGLCPTRAPVAQLWRSLVGSPMSLKGAWRFGLRLTALLAAADSERCPKPPEGVAFTRTGRGR